ncbi:hypothetical protein MNBD_GAMMA03-1944 [hydrothermal vent metagenome]|uniref:DUF1318 domain-containing protein n=1 Tax=hydrothermal vent metagenome TaxID=652676 RepID=A0A3B0VW24_9ZZZZ
MKSQKIRYLTLFIVLLMSTSMGIHAMTLSSAKAQLNAFKTQGKVGEKLNGFLAVIQDRKATRKLVKIINKERLKYYEKIAIDNQLTLQEVEYIAGQKSTEKAKKDHYIQKDGQWIKK